MPLSIWEDYFSNTIKQDAFTDIHIHNQIEIAPLRSKWIYLDTIPGGKVEDGNVFNGIINLTVEDNKTLECYALLFNADKQTIVNDDVNLNKAYGPANISWYERAYGGYGQLSGSSDAPVLESETIDITGRDKYEILLTGYEAPYFNAGEAAPLYYDGNPIVPNSYGLNCTNFSVIYKLHIKGCENKKMYLEYNPYTNPNNEAT